MNYGLRNSLLLGGTLLVIVVTGAIWIYYFEFKHLVDLENKLITQETELATLRADVERYEESFELNEDLKSRIESFPKVMFPNSRLSVLYNYMNQADRGNVFLNYSFTDSTNYDEYGRTRFTIDAVSNYNQLRDYIHTIENGPYVVKISSLQLRPTNNAEDYNEVGFRITAEAYYDRTGSSSTIRRPERISSAPERNPFFPLVRDIPSNEADLPDVERSRLTALSPSAIFLIDQRGDLVRVEVGDRVHLGYLESISVEEQSATFFLNKGGLTERTTLRLQQ